MKQLLILMSGLALFLSCSRKPGADAAKKDRVELTPFVISEVVLKDTMQLKTAVARSMDSGRTSLSDYRINFDLEPRFFSELEFRNFRRALWQVIRDPKSRVYMGEDLHPAGKQEIRDKVVLCDSILMAEYDAEGEEMTTHLWACDSTSMIYNANKIRFFEARYFNPSTGAIEIETLGYSVMSFITEKEAWKELFYVFRDEATAKRAKQFLK